MQINADIAQKYKLTDDEIQLTRSGYRPLCIKANDYFLKENQVCDHIGVVTKGLLRSFFYDDHANEITTEFYPEGSLVISFDSFNNRVPSKEYIKAIEDSDLMVITYQQQKELYEKVPAWNQICKDLADIKSQEMIDRATQFQTMSATDRYRKFCSDYPQVLQKATLGHIASYLGIDIATLSRIRRKK